MQLQIPFVALCLRLFGLKTSWRLLTMLTFPSSLPTNPSNSSKQAIATVRNLKYARTHSFYEGTCLSRSLVLRWHLLRQGIQSELHIGVQTNDGFRAHAWVVHDGRPLNAVDAVYQRYQHIEQFELL